MFTTGWHPFASFTQHARAVFDFIEQMALATGQPVPFNFYWLWLTLFPTVYVTVIVPAGTIMPYLFKSSSASKIPTGWALCNGLNGSVDLRSKFTPSMVYVQKK